MIIFSKHSRVNLWKRKIHEVWVEETIARPDMLARVGRKFYAVRKINGKTLKVVYVKENYIKIVTIYWLK